MTNLVLVLIIAFLVMGHIFVFREYRKMEALVVVVPPPVQELSIDIPTPVVLESTSTPEETRGEESAPALRVALQVPFTSQAPLKNWDQPWQDACEEAAVLMLDAYYKGHRISPYFAHDEILKMVAWQDEREWGYSISIEQIQKFANDYMGLQTIILEDPTIEQLKQLLDKQHPILVVADGHALPNPYFTGDGPEYHALIITGYDATGFITNDPGTQHGEDFHYTYRELMNAMHDWNDGDVPNGRAAVLVVES